MTYAEEDYLQLSGIQHYCFCKRQWGLINLEQVWLEDGRTVAGRIMHRNVDVPSHRVEKGVRSVRA
ncbi:MAG: Dna2/Cas4 domain-containing protein, partial [Candidatus Methanomethylophilaceae archaeon]|nr:Dna2/Cas4 domain-containing protein [Candidatus Methanomethylophilaceae archaeon]